MANTNEIHKAINKSLGVFGDIGKINDSFSLGAAATQEAINNMKEDLDRIAAEREAAAAAERAEKRAYEKWLADNFSIKKIIYSKAAGSTCKAVAFSMEPPSIIVDKKIISLSDIIKIDLDKVETMITRGQSSQPGSIGNAVIGGLLAGAAGAVVGASSTQTDTSSVTFYETTCTGITLYLADMLAPIFKISGNEQFNLDVYATLLAAIELVKREGTRNERKTQRNPRTV